MKKLLVKVCLPVLLVGIALSNVILPGASQTAHAYSNSDMIDDSIFDQTNSMSTGDIQNFLNQFPGSCLKNYSAPDPQSWYSYGGMVSAAQVIKDASSEWGINPQVILTTLEKEEGLVRGDGAYGCNPTAYWSAMGYDCPGNPGNVYSSVQATASPNNYAGGVPADMQGSIGPTCVASPIAVGFSAQVNHGAWQLEFGRYRSEGNGNLNWDGDNNISYVGYMTAGCRARVQGGTVACYDGVVTISGQTFTLANGATASLYSYTPFLQSFDTIFAGWFGDPTSACLGTANVSAASGYKIMSYKYSPTSPTNLAFTIMNNTGSTCVEAHIWSPGFTSWLTHRATAMKATDPSTGTLVASKAAVDGQESLNYILYDPPSGQVEIHRISPSLTKFPGYYDVVTNLKGVTPTTGQFVAGDFFGRGYDQLAYVLYNGAGGHVEIHMFDPTLRSAIGYYDMPADLTGTNASTGTFVAGDFLGRGYSQMVYVLYNDGVGRVETHMFNQALSHAIGFQDTITNLGGFDPSQ